MRDGARPGVRAIVEHWRPFVLIQAGALALVVAYFWSDTVRSACDAVGRMQTAGGLWFAVLTTSLAGALLPEAAKLLTGQGRERTWKQVGGDTFFGLWYFAVAGVQVHYFYKFQTWAWGEGNEPWRLALKVAFDQIFFTPVVAIPLALFLGGIRNSGYSLRGGLAVLRPRNLARRAPQLLIPSSTFWIPMCVMIYALPTPLQFPLFALAVGAWSLLVMFVLAEK